MNPLLAGKVGIVTGASRGLGRVIAATAAAEGAVVVACGRSEADSNVNGDRDAPPGAGVRYRTLDVTREADVAVLVRDTVAQYGRLDFIVNCAGSPTAEPRAVLRDRLTGALPPNSVLTATEPEYSAVNDVNAAGPLWMCKHAAEAMLAAGHGGAIVNIGSIAGLAGQAHWVPYTMAKHALVGLTRALAADRRLAGAGIRCNCVCPSFIGSPAEPGSVLATGGEPSPFIAKLNGLHPPGRIATQEEIANLVVFLCSDRIPFLNGVAIPIDGGLMASLWPQ